MIAGETPPALIALNHAQGRGNVSVAGATGTFLFLSGFPGISGGSSRARCRDILSLEMCVGEQMSPVGCG